MAPDFSHEGTAISRRALLARAALAAGAIGSSLAGRSAPPSYAAAEPGPGQNPADVLSALVEGNKRFMSGQAAAPRRQPSDFAAVAEGQSPEAVIVGCADSRVPPELVFDQGVGDLFVVRVAGNVVSGAGAIVKGSIEYAVAELNARLIVVLGHSGCGAVKAALKHIDNSDKLPGAIRELVDILRPVVARVKGQPGDPLENAIRANVANGVGRLKGLAPILAPAVKKGTLQVVGAVYDLRSGAVTQVA
jgi:carbonic anhydrase